MKGRKNIKINFDIYIEILLLTFNYAVFIISDLLYKSLQIFYQ